MEIYIYIYIYQSILWHTIIGGTYNETQKWDREFVFAHNQNLDYKSTSQRKLQLPRL